MSGEPVRVGVGVIVVRDGRVLLGRRTGSHGEGRWSFPGGHLEFGETVEGCARREVLEETGLVLHDLRPAPWTSDVFEAEGKHYVTLFMQARCTGEPQLLEPHRCEGWQWFDVSALPRPLFQPIDSLLATGFVPQDLKGAST